ncbi:hypothetical protein CRYUN_Cryun05aG0146300 [Craigia yunnanensis]
MECQFLEIHPPTGCDLSQNIEYASQAALWGVEGLPDLGQIYPLGGSADRLDLVDPDTGECLPAAMLPYCRRTLLEGLIRDLQLCGKRCITPVAIMTSSTKNNHEHIASLCERLGWFGRGRLSFQLFEQPLVPAVSAEDGQWLIRKPFVPVYKPGDHDVIWKLAYDKGIFQWFYDHGRKGATVRQVRNWGLLPASGTQGLQKESMFELRRRTLMGSGHMVCHALSTLSLISLESQADLLHLIEFPANTNILYVDLPSAELVASTRSERSQLYIRIILETSTVSLVAGWSALYKGVEDKLDTFIVYNKRRRVTSSAKKKRKHADMSLHQTPDGSLLDIMRNAYDLLSQCDIDLPEVEENDKYVDSGPPFLIFFHPALGPLWEVTRQKNDLNFLVNSSMVFISISGLAVQSDPIPLNLMDSGSWFRKYNINGSHILLELVEL